MPSSKKDLTITLRIPEKTKHHIQELADKNFRSFQDQAFLLLTKALNNEYFNPKDWQ